MSRHYADIAFTADVRRAQERRGSRELYERVHARARPGPGPDPLTATERAFVAERDGFYVATVGETGWPYVQYRGGPPGFLRVLDEQTLGWADFQGNLQYITTGNVAGEARASLFIMDYAHRRRLKVYGMLRAIDVEDDPALVERLADPAYDAVVERGMVMAVAAFDWNCPQHITQRFTLEEIAALMGPGDGADDDCCPEPDDAQPPAARG